MNSPAGEPHRPRLSLVVTTFRETDVLRGSLPRIASVLRAIPGGAELIFVDDGSLDATPAWVRSQFDAYADLTPRLFVHPQNRGRGAALRTGFGEARGAYAGYMDLDLEVDAAYLPACLEALDRGADVAIALRTYVRMRKGFDLRTFLSLGYRHFSKLVLRHPLHDTEAGFKFFRREALSRLLPQLREEGWFFDSEISMLAVLAGLRIAEVPVEFRRRDDKVSTVKVGRDIRRYLVALAKFSARRGDVARALR